MVKFLIGKTKKKWSQSLRGRPKTIMVKFLRGMTIKVVNSLIGKTTGEVCPDRETPKVLRRPPSGLVGTDPQGHQLLKSCSTHVEVLPKYTFSIVSLKGRPPKS